MNYNATHLSPEGNFKMSIKTFIFSQPGDKPIVKEKKEIDQTYKNFRF